MKKKGICLEMIKFQIVGRDGVVIENERLNIIASDLWNKPRVPKRYVSPWKFIDDALSKDAFTWYEMIGDAIRYNPGYEEWKGLKQSIFNTTFSGISAEDWGKTKTYIFNKHLGITHDLPVWEQMERVKRIHNLCKPYFDLIDAFIKRGYTFRQVREDI
jgi:hypothetical protein